MGEFRHSVLLGTDRFACEKPVDRLSMTAMPMMPMLEAKEVRKVRPFLVLMLLKESLRAVKKLMLVFFRVNRSGLGRSW